MDKICRLNINASKKDIKHNIYLCIAILSILCCGCSLSGKVDDVNRYFIDGDVKALAISAAHGDVNQINRLIAQGIDVNARGLEDMTPLFWALINESKDGTAALLDNGANPNFIARNGASFVSLAAITEDDYFLKAALSHGGNPNIIDPKKNMTALERTIYRDKINNAKILIEAGANLTETESNNDIPIIEAALIDRYEFVVLFLEHMINNNQLTNETCHKLLKYINNSNLMTGTDAFIWKEKARGIVLKHSQ
jgi:ankyrin repeat protein